MTKPNQTNGTVLAYHSNIYTVSCEAATYRCVVKGILKKEGVDVLVGDQVTIDNLDDTNQTARIISVELRKNELARPKMANMTCAIIVASIQDPDLDLEQLDRYITHVVMANIKPIICISKTDLASDKTLLETIHQTYKPLDVQVFETTIRKPESISEMFAALKGETAVLAGQSGVGKSSLLNAAKPDLALAVKDVSQKLGRGQHTTRQVSLITLTHDTLIADSPGFSYLKFDTVMPVDVEQAFLDFASYRDKCRFDNCLHIDEAECAVKDNLDAISPNRYRHYLQFQEEAKTYALAAQSTSKKQEYGYKTLKKGKDSELRILRLKGKDREASRRSHKQRLSDSDLEDDTLE